MPGSFPAADVNNPGSTEILPKRVSFTSCWAGSGEGWSKEFLTPFQILHAMSNRDPLCSRKLKHPVYIQWTPAGIGFISFSSWGACARSLVLFEGGFFPTPPNSHRHSSPYNTNHSSITPAFAQIKLSINFPSASIHTSQPFPSPEPWAPPYRSLLHCPNQHIFEAQPTRPNRQTRQISSTM